MRKQTVWAMVAMFAVGPCWAADSASTRPALTLIPQPVECRMADGVFTLSTHTQICCGTELRSVAQLAGEQLGLKTAPNDNGVSGPAIRLSLDSSLAAEGYQLAVTSKRITIAGGSPPGVFYGIQTLRQIIGPDQAAAGPDIPCLTIQDHPRLAWRGLMMDCSRTFQSLDYLRKTIDRLAFYKMNVLHLHLTDDQGWRVQIRKYPELTDKGARFSAKYGEPPSHQGFYTQPELRELIRYASRQGVTIVPEIEMPGHSTAVLVCHPELSCTGKMPDDIFPFGKGPGKTKDVFCAGNDAVFAFLQDVLDEVMEIFPSKYIHIGGDEVPKDRWMACPKCQACIKAEGLKDECQLQGYFVRRIEKYLATKGRRLIGWDEILEGGLAPRAAVMSWRGVTGGIKAAKAGHEVIMSPTTHCYFDYTYQTIDSKRVYGFDPVAGLSLAEAPYVLGVQANFWSHLDRESSLVDKQIFPRLLSLAERGWSPPSATDWSTFEPRLLEHLAWLRRLQITYWTHPGSR
jgi:hexosaminidase